MASSAVEGRSGGALVFLWLTAFWVALDQLTKVLVQHHVHLYETIPLLPVLDLTYADNTGAAFNFLRDASGWQRWFFTGLALIVSVVLVRWLARLRRAEWWMASALALILAGALGNVIDRLRQGFVVDFILAHWHNHYFPAFNVADSGITIGVAMVLIDAWRNNR